MKCTMWIAFLLIVVVSAVRSQEQDIEHVESPGSLTYTALTEDKVLSKLVDTAREFAQNAPLPRVAFSDLTYPRDRNEYELLDGWGLMTITVVSQLAEELPLARVYLRNGTRGIELNRITERLVTLEEPIEVVEVLGSYRYDAVYEFPMFIRAANVELVLDFAANRTGFVLKTYPVTQDPYELPLEPPTAEHPRRSAVTAIIEREIPLLAPYLEP
jgi:hypothetical protein